MIRGDKIVKRRVWVIVVTLLIVSLSIIPLFKIKINPDLESYFPETMEARVNNDKVKELFPNSEKLVVVLERNNLFDPDFLEALSLISEEINYSPIFGDATSITTLTKFSGEDGFLNSTPLIEEYYMEESKIEEIKQEIADNDLVYGKIVSKGFDKTLIVVGYGGEVEDSTIVAELEGIIAQYPIDAKVTLSGFPMLREEANNKISADLMLLLPLSVLMMLLILTLLLGEVRYMLLPFSVVIFSTIFAMGLMPLFGWELSIVGVLIPIMMIAIANNYGIHFIVRYNEIKPEGTPAQLIDFLSRPVTICGLTTIAGVMGLMAHILGPIKQMGVITSLSIGFALLLSLLFIPSVLSYFNPSKGKRKGENRIELALGKLLNRVAKLVTSHPKVTLSLFAALLLISAALLPTIKVTPDSSTVLPDDHPFNYGMALLDNEFAGNKYINLVVEGEMVDPQLLSNVEELQSSITNIEGVGGAVSITDIFKEIGKALLDRDDPLYGKLPDSREMAAQYLELFLLNSDPEEMENYLDFDFKNGLITIQYRANTIKDAERISDEVKQLVEESNLDVTVGGYSLIEYEMNRSVVKGQYLSLLFAFGVIFILLSLTFRDSFAGLLGSLPLLIAVVVTLATMALLGIELDIVTTLISSISIGLGVDFTIHLFWRIESETEEGNSLRDGVITAVTTTGKGITINALSVMAGFSLLFLSQFPMIQRFALLIILSLLLSLLSALLLMPALSLLIKPKFLIKRR